MIQALTISENKPKLIRTDAGSKQCIGRCQQIPAPLLLPSGDLGGWRQMAFSGVLWPKRRISRMNWLDFIWSKSCEERFQFQILALFWAWSKSRTGILFLQQTAHVWRFPSLMLSQWRAPAAEVEVIRFCRRVYVLCFCGRGPQLEVSASYHSVRSDGSFSPLVSARSCISPGSNFFPPRQELQWISFLVTNTTQIRTGRLSELLRWHSYGDI